MTEFIFFQYLRIPILGSQECDYYENPKFLSTQFVKIIHSVWNFTIQIFMRKYTRAKLSYEYLQTHLFHGLYIDILPNTHQLFKNLSLN